MHRISYIIQENKDAGQNLLEAEAYVLCYLKGPGIPFVKSYGFSGDYNVLVMELLGKSLEDLFQETNRKFSLKTVCMIALQLIEKLEYIHNKHIIHRDIKPDNFVIGLEETSHIIYVIDFGLAKKYRSSRTLQHIKFANNKKLTGTARYASINALKGCEQSRRDDLEAIGYVLMYFLRGSLPWQGLKVDKREDRYKKIYEKKKSTTAEELCMGFPVEFAEYINYTRTLAFEQEPDYNYLKGLFKSTLEKNGLVDDKNFDWTKSNPIPSNITKQTSPQTKPILNETLDKERNDTFNNINPHVNPYLHTMNNIDDEANQKINQSCSKAFNHKENANERINTKAANYNATVQVTNTELQNKKTPFQTTNINNNANQNTNVHLNMGVSIDNTDNHPKFNSSEIKKNEVMEISKEPKRKKSGKCLIL